MLEAMIDEIWFIAMLLDFRVTLAMVSRHLLFLSQMLLADRMD